MLRNDTQSRDICTPRKENVYHSPAKKPVLGTRQMHSPRRNYSTSGDSKNRKRRERASIACLNCRMRKVRCNVIEGAPCSNCKMDMIQCVVRRDRRNRKHFASILPTLVANSHLTGHLGDHTAVMNPVSDPANLQFESQKQREKSQSSSVILQETENITTTDMKLDGKGPLTVSIDQKDDCWPSVPLPSFIKAFPRGFSSAHVKFLVSEGALNLPSWPLQRAAIEAYAEFAYPYMPLIQLHDFLKSINSRKDSHKQQVSLLLYQAILFAGSAFVDRALLEEDKSEFSSRRLARRELSKRVTLLYDLGYERESTTLTQTALLMSSWSDTQHDHKDSWHWMGLAVSSAFAMGLNNNSALQGLPRIEQKLRKRIWWSCYMRDHFLALGLRRPTRIKDDDVNIPGMEISDFDIAVLSPENEVISSESSVLHSLEKQIELAELCVHRSRLSTLIGPILRIQDAYDQSEAISSSSQSDFMVDLEWRFTQTKSALEQWKSSLPISCQYEPLLMPDEVAARSASLTVHQSHLQMAFHTLIYILHRPRFLPTSPKKVSLLPTPPTSDSGTMVLNSAVQISRIAHSLRELKLDEYLPVTGVTIIFPAMVVSLLEMRNSDERSRHRAVNRFSTCMRVMQTLQETYVSADFTINYLKEALQKAKISISWAEVSDDAPETQTSMVLSPQKVCESPIESSLMLLQDSLLTPTGNGDYVTPPGQTFAEGIRGAMPTDEPVQSIWAANYEYQDSIESEGSLPLEWNTLESPDGPLSSLLDIRSEDSPGDFETNMTELSEVKDF